MNDLIKTYPNQIKIEIKSLDFIVKNQKIYQNSIFYSNTRIQFDSNTLSDRSLGSRIKL